LARPLDDEAKGVVNWAVVIAPYRIHEVAPSAMAGRGERGKARSALGSPRFGRMRVMG
jgi:hypothetical protein